MYFKHFYSPDEIVGCCKSCYEGKYRVTGRNENDPIEVSAIKSRFIVSPSPSLRHLISTFEFTKSAAFYISRWQ